MEMRVSEDAVATEGYVAEQSNERGHRSGWVLVNRCEDRVFDRVILQSETGVGKD